MLVLNRIKEGSETDGCLLCEGRSGVVVKNAARCKKKNVDEQGWWAGCCNVGEARVVACGLRHAAAIIGAAPFWTAPLR